MAALRQRFRRLAHGVAEHGEIDVEHALHRRARSGAADVERCDAGAGSVEERHGDGADAGLQLLVDEAEALGAHFLDLGAQPVGVGDRARQKSAYALLFCYGIISKSHSN